MFNLLPALFLLFVQGSGNLEAYSSRAETLRIWIVVQQAEAEVHAETPFSIDPKVLSRHFESTHQPPILRCTQGQIVCNTPCLGFGNSLSWRAGPTRA